MLADTEGTLHLQIRYISCCVVSMGRRMDLSDVREESHFINDTPGGVLRARQLPPLLLSCTHNLDITNSRHPFYLLLDSIGRAAHSHCFSVKALEADNEEACLSAAGHTRQHKRLNLNLRLRSVPLNLVLRNGRPSIFQWRCPLYTQALGGQHLHLDTLWTPWDDTHRLNGEWGT